jgi:double-stranded uracil-DNA glycosylase
MEAVIERPLVPLAYEARLDALLEARVGLWDTVASAKRRGSLDGAIRGHSANDLRRLVAGLPELRAVAFNGGKSAAIGMAELAGMPGLALLPLPSSSPAYTLAFEEKAARWRALRDFL